MGKTAPAYTERTMDIEEKTCVTRISETCLVIHAHIDFNVMGSSEQ